jgi:hypothetical protein
LAPVDDRDDAAAARRGGAQCLQARAARIGARMLDVDDDDGHLKLL